MTKTRKKTVRLPLTVAGPGLVLPGMTAEQLKVGCTPSPALVEFSPLGNDSCTSCSVFVACPSYPLARHHA